MNQDLIKRRTDEVMADIGQEAIDILRMKGMTALESFIDTKLISYRAKWAAETFPSVCLDEEMVGLREEIGRDLEQRLRMGIRAFNPASSIEEQWNRDANLRQEFFNNFDSYSAYLKAMEAGQVKIAADRVVR